MSPRQSQGPEADEKLAALLTNAGAVRAIASSVQGTIGPKGLDTLLVDRYGEIVVTNDGMTILTRMDVSHPAAKMVIGAAKAQEAEVGDGTTTTTIVAAALLEEGVSQAGRGVPVSRLIDGIKSGISGAVSFVRERATAVRDIDDPVLRQVALIAGRGDSGISELVVSAARMVGEAKLLEDGFKLSDIIVAKEGAESEIFGGIIVDKTRLNEEMPKAIREAKILVIDDSLEAETVDDEALSTEAGFKRYLALQEEFQENLAKIVSLGVNCVIVDKGVSDLAEEILTDANIMVLGRVASAELRKVCDYTGARAIKRTGLKKVPGELRGYIGGAREVHQDEKLENVRVLGGAGLPMATILVGASTEEVRRERERICADAACAVQAALKGGVVSGGGAIEVAAALEVERMKAARKGMQIYGLDCVVEALKKPLAQIVANAGFNPLEKVGDVVSCQRESGNTDLAVDCDTGEVIDMVKHGVLDPAIVKAYALNAASEIACAILRIDTIIRKKDDAGTEGAKGRPEEAGF